MSELRRNEVLDRTVLIAEDRQHRPHDYAGLENTLRVDLEGTEKSCPFCRGHEAETPPATYQVLDEQGNWLVRVVPNKYPAVTPDSTSARGAHEIIVESPDHLSRTSELSASQFLSVLNTYQQRLLHWREHGDLAYAALFKNVGALAGASLVHLHSQFVTLPAVPAPVLRELAQLQQVEAQTGQCAFCTDLAKELRDSPRLIASTRGYLAFCPYVSLHPYETWIMPLDHESGFEETQSLSMLADFLHDIVGRVEKVAGAAGYNLLLMNGPWQYELSSLYHWRIELRPRLSPLAGLELGTGIHINQIAPERAADLLKNSA